MDSEANYYPITIIIWLMKLQEQSHIQLNDIGIP